MVARKRCNPVGRGGFYERGAVVSGVAKRIDCRTVADRRAEADRRAVADRRPVADRKAGRRLVWAAHIVVVLGRVEHIGLPLCGEEETAVRSATRLVVPEESAALQMVENSHAGRGGEIELMEGPASS